MSWKGELLRYMDPDQTARYDVPDMPTQRIDQGDFHTVQNDDTQPLAAQRQSAHNASARERKSERREAAREQRKQQREQDRIDRARREVASLPQEPPQLVRFAAPTIGKISNLPTPGGLFPLIAALLFFIFAIVPVGAQGSTRLELIWRVLTGGAYLPPEPGSKRARIAEAQQQQQDTADAVAAAAEGGVVGAGVDVGAAVGGIISQWWDN